jgi:nucleotide-binding universal stress UspA family protein
MKKVLVTTDFSSNSKAGLRFAIQMASQQECELTFFHSYYIMKPTSWAEKTFTSYENHEATQIKAKLEKFVASVYNGMGILPGKINHVLVSSFIADANIMKYAKDKAFDLICISRRGEGKMKKIFGTNTSNLILQSEVPVIAVPNTYRQTKIKSFLYASDLSNLENEMKKVVDFASPFGAQIEILHLNYPSDIVFNAKVIENVIHKFPKSDIKYSLENINLLYNLVVNLQGLIKKHKPSVLVMFTDQKQGFFQKLFLSSSTSEYSLNSSVPVLVYPKK